jgi:S-adenosylmethionine:tRNA ribosyltransferase-isomerase
MARGVRRRAATAGALALPPYIDRPTGPSAQDTSDYQTMFATHDGAVAAPTAGLHFTPALRTALEQAGITHRDRHAACRASARSCRCGPTRYHTTICMRSAGRSPRRPPTRSTARQGRLVAVGTTSLRLLESAADGDRGDPEPFAGETDLFILPGHRFRTPSTC